MTLKRMEVILRAAQRAGGYAQQAALEPQLNMRRALLRYARREARRLFQLCGLEGR